MGKTLVIVERNCRLTKPYDKSASRHGVEVWRHGLDKFDKKIRQRFSTAQARLQQGRFARNQIHWAYFATILFFLAWNEQGQITNGLFVLNEWRNAKEDFFYSSFYFFVFFLINEFLENFLCHYKIKIFWKILNTHWWFLLSHAITLAAEARTKAWNVPTISHSKSFSKSDKIDVTF